MKKTCASFIALAVLSVVEPTDAARTRVDFSRAQSLEEVNQALVGRTVSIRLFEGKTVRRAKSVRVGPEFIHWDGAKGPKQMSTSEVERVSIRAPIFRGVVWGLALGTLFGLDSVYNHLETDGFPVDSAVRTVLLKGSMLGGAALGGVVGTATVKRRGHVFYEAPLDRYLDDCEPGSGKPIQALAHSPSGEGNCPNSG